MQILVFHQDDVSSIHKQQKCFPPFNVIWAPVCLFAAKNTPKSLRKSSMCSREQWPPCQYQISFENIVHMPITKSTLDGTQQWYRTQRCLATNTPMNEVNNSGASTSSYKSGTCHIRYTKGFYESFRAGTKNSSQTIDSPTNM